MLAPGQNIGIWSSLMFFLQFPWDILHRDEPCQVGLVTSFRCEVRGQAASPGAVGTDRLHTDAQDPST